MRFGLLFFALVELAAALMTPISAVRAHEIRPAYLQIDEIGPGRYQLRHLTEFWATALIEATRPSLRVVEGG